jgi:selenoprotein W-related protein
MAFWMGSELYVAGGSQVAVTLTPGKGGVFRVTLNDEVVWDKDVLGRYPSLPDSKELKAKVANMVEAATAAV